MDHWNCPVPNQVTWENNLSPLNEMHIHQQNHWNRVLFYWYQSYHWHQWTISLTNRIRLCLLDTCALLSLSSSNETLRLMLDILLEVTNTTICIQFRDRIMVDNIRLRIIFSVRLKHRTDCCVRQTQTEDLQTGR